jgi:phenylalanyl-tRNA synthetase beta chain
VPIVSVDKAYLLSQLELPPLASTAHSSEDERISALCFAFGIELDEVTSERAQQLKEKGAVDAGASDAELYKFDIPANRYDLVCAEGIALALRVFLGRQALPAWHCVLPAHPLHFTVDRSMLAYRPVLVCAVLRGVAFTPARYASFIDLQEKLHFNICRRRALASVGTHDLDSVAGPFLYRAVAPADVHFAPLGAAAAVRGTELKAHMDEHRPTISKFLPLLRADAYPLITDAHGRVLSLPPIINSEHSKISLATRNVLIEVTATDQTKAEIVLNTIVCLFSQYCDAPHTVEQVRVTGADGQTRVWPQLDTRAVPASVSWINKCIGISLEREHMARILTKMSLAVQQPLSAADADQIVALIPPTRSDVLHACDVMEDVAIAFGYDNIPKTVPQIACDGKMQPLNKLTDLLRNELAQAGYTEILTFSLLSREEHYRFMRRDDDNAAVSIANPATLDFQVARTSLLPGLFKTVHHNKGQPKPLKLFEVQDVILRDGTVDVGVRNERRVSAIHCGLTAGFEQLQGLLDRVMEVLDIVTPDEKKRRVAEHDAALKAGARTVPVENATYRVEALSPADAALADARWMFDAHGARVLFAPHNGAERSIGYIGFVHPEVINNFELSFPCSAFELQLEPFL